MNIHWPAARLAPAAVPERISFTIFAAIALLTGHEESRSRHCAMVIPHPHEQFWEFISFSAAFFCVS
ncbi:MAG TPA: hypothetical protein VKS44_07715, partial [Candidatus Acidoferrales bacterium]|nr:hypothetical protein [Candidatus Acidoferrales bacterium]